MVKVYTFEQIANLVAESHSPPRLLIPKKRANEDVVCLPARYDPEFTMAFNRIMLLACAAPVGKKNGNLLFDVRGVWHKVRELARQCPSVDLVKARIDEQNDNIPTRMEVVTKWRVVHERNVASAVPIPDLRGVSDDKALVLVVATLTLQTILAAGMRPQDKLFTSDDVARVYSLKEAYKDDNYVSDRLCVLCEILDTLMVDPTYKTVMRAPGDARPIFSDYV